MTTPIRNYKRGTLPNQIEFDPALPFSTAGGNGDLYRAILHHSSHSDGSPFQYSYVALKRMRWGTDDKDTVSVYLVFSVSRINCYSQRLDHILEEAYVWKRLHHVNILRFLGILYENDDLYLVSPFATHGSLPQYIVAHPDANRRMFVSCVEKDIYRAGLIPFESSCGTLQLESRTSTAKISSTGM